MGAPPEIPKPHELVAAHDAAAELFVLLRRWFAVPEQVTIDLRGVDSARAELDQPAYVMAMAMRKLQVLYHITDPDVETTTDVVLTVIQDLERALVTAPALRLRETAARTDWDAELEALGDPAPRREVADGETDELMRFRHRHGLLRDAARAVLRASEGEIRRLT